jgi:hypothetical protein
VQKSGRETLGVIEDLDDLIDEYAGLTLYFSSGVLILLIAKYLLGYKIKISLLAIFISIIFSFVGALIVIIFSHFNIFFA